MRCTIVSNELRSLGLGLGLSLSLGVTMSVFENSSHTITYRNCPTGSFYDAN